MPITSVDDLKAHLNITGTQDDAVIAQKIAVAEAFVNRWLDTPMADLDPLPADLLEAVRLLVGHLFENREATLVGIGAEALPLGFWDIINVHRSWGFGACRNNSTV
ncbi:head-tail connector protein [Pararhodobacter aggregans]|uniref:Phage gp6-like head-tail connector protein n=1 Tax=Pararhodobacter aggregans TaxID=404875 RepID=A0A2T7UVZ4_9RHOB|nr:head-tail connector protein [Pararhodobacter aggregans]PTX04609.1 gp6-like head-tail connector protein [Pararhodobacter aggregans]PVE48950.1 hypothetical protein DDE23_00650 [Pararhodobacter aggregans]